MRVLENLNPCEVFRYFEDISKIPRCSKQEKNISDYLLDFGKSLNIEVVQDEHLNIYMRKPPTKGYENGETVMFQGHMDMVCEKNDGIIHDFSKDPLKLRVISDKIYATDTTLGADNGIAVAYIMALMASKDIAHPEIEALITVDEETSMNGAKKFNPEFFKAKYLINVDSSDDSRFLVSCAGGVRASVIKKVSTEKLQGKVLTIKVRGLKGGHSGIDIDKERANANKVLGRILINVDLNYSNINLLDIKGGAKDNAIPREAECQIVVRDEDLDNIILSVMSAFNSMKKEYTTEEDFNVEVIEEQNPKRNEMINLEDTRDVIDLLYLIPNGVKNKSTDIKDLVITSNNLGVVEYDGETVIFKNAIRSSIESSKYNLMREIDILGRAFKAITKESASYPGWEYDKHSKIRDICQRVYKDMFSDGGGDVYAIHAGVECGLIKQKLTHLDMISFGPVIKDNHTPGEWVSISSVDRVWNFIKGVLKEIK